MDRIATSTGLYPLPDWSKTELRGLKGKQRHDLISGDEGAEIVEVYEKARAEAIDWQREAGLDRIVEGQLRWDDMLCHPLAVHDAVETGGLKRYYDNNNFYREVTVTGPLTEDGDLAAEIAATAERVDDAPLQAVVPGPYSLSRLATDDHYGSEDRFLDAVADFLAGEIAQVPAVETAYVLEPSLGIDDADDPAAVGEAIDTVAAAFDDAATDVLVHPYWGAPSDAVYERLLDGAADGIGFDLVIAPDASEALVEAYGAPSVASLGIVDGQNTRVESVDELHERIDAIAGIDAPDRVYLTTNTEGFYLPVGPFEAKLGVLGRAATATEVQT